MRVFFLCVYDEKFGLTEKISVEVDSERVYRNE